LRFFAAINDNLYPQAILQDGQIIRLGACHRKISQAAALGCVNRRMHGVAAPLDKKWKQATSIVLQPE
jgi:hypothetical protein